MERTSDLKDSNKIFKLIVISVVAAVLLKTFNIGMLIVAVASLVVGAALAKGGTR
jgi:hypothetical protein